MFIATPAGYYTEDALGDTTQYPNGVRQLAALDDDELVAARRILRLDDLPPAQPKLTTLWCGHPIGSERKARDGTEWCSLCA
jgi:hypothetical protein